MAKKAAARKRKPKHPNMGKVYWIIIGKHGGIMRTDNNKADAIAGLHECNDEYPSDSPHTLNECKCTVVGTARPISVDDNLIWYK